MKINLSLLCICFSLLFISGQSVNNEFAIEGASPYLLGSINQDGLSAKPYNDWFNKNLNDYEPNSEIIEQLQSKLKDYDILLFMGTWCGDSKREVPRFYKVLEACEYPMDKLKSVAVSAKRHMYKQSPEGYELGLNIHRVPTFIISKDGKEINRIVEEPVENLETDLLNIISGEAYQSNYYIVTEVENILKNSGVKGLKKEKNKLLSHYKTRLKSMSTLNTYAFILFTTNRQEESIEVCKMNIEFFPYESYTYQSLARKYQLLNNTSKAIQLYKKALKLDPENTNLKETLNHIKSEN